MSSQTLVTSLFFLHAVVYFIAASFSPGDDQQRFHVSMFFCCWLGCLATNFFSNFCSRWSRIFIKWTGKCFKVPVHRGQLVVIHSLAYGGRGYFAGRTTNIYRCRNWKRRRRRRFTFDSTLGFPGEGPRKRPRDVKDQPSMASDLPSSKKMVCAIFIL